MVTDPIADLLTRLRNASRVRKSVVTCASSKVKREVLRVLKDNGYVQDVQDVQDEQGRPMLHITLVPGRGEMHLKRVSKPGRRLYVKRDEIQKVLNGFGMSILSTPRGMMTGQKARSEGIGGEFICEVW